MRILIQKADVPDRQGQRAMDSWRDWIGKELPAIRVGELTTGEQYSLMTYGSWPNLVEPDDYAVLSTDCFEAIRFKDPKIVADTPWHGWYNHHPGLFSGEVYLIFPKEVCEEIADDSGE